jgi:hypothetical protein
MKKIYHFFPKVSNIGSLSLTNGSSQSTNNASNASFLPNSICNSSISPGPSVLQKDGKMSNASSSCSRLTKFTNDTNCSVSNYQKRLKPKDLSGEENSLDSDNDDPGRKRKIEDNQDSLPKRRRTLESPDVVTDDYFCNGTKNGNHINLNSNYEINSYAKNNGKTYFNKSKGKILTSDLYRQQKGVKRYAVDEMQDDLNAIASQPKRRRSETGATIFCEEESRNRSIAHLPKSAKRKLSKDSVNESVIQDADISEELLRQTGNESETSVKSDAVLSLSQTENESETNLKSVNSDAELPLSSLMSICCSCHNCRFCRLSRGSVDPYAAFCWIWLSSKPFVRQNRQLE